MRGGRLRPAEWKARSAYMPATVLIDLVPATQGRARPPTDWPATSLEQDDPARRVGCRRWHGGLRETTRRALPPGWTSTPTLPASHAVVESLAPHCSRTLVAPGRERCVPERRCCKAAVHPRISRPRLHGEDGEYAPHQPSRDRRRDCGRRPCAHAGATRRDRHQRRPMDRAPGRDPAASTATRLGCPGRPRRPRPMEHWPG